MANLLKKLKSNTPIILIFLFIFILYGIKANIPYFIGVPQREAQTASLTRYFYNYGINLLYPKYDLTPEPQYLLLEFPIYQAIVSVVYHFIGVNEIAGKMVSVFTAIGSMIYIYLIGEKLFSNKNISILAAILFAIAPFSIRFLPVFMVDPLVIFLSLVTLYHGMRWTETNSKIDFAIFFLFGLMACLTKFVTFIPICFPLILFLVLRVRKALRSNIKLILSFCIVAIIWISILFTWILWSSYLNGQTTLLAFDTSASTSASITKFIGTLEMRFTNSYYETIKWIYSEYIPIWFPNWIILLLLALSFFIGILRKKYTVILFLTAWGVGFFFIFAFFFPAVSTHSYYWLPSIPIVVLLLTNTVDGFMDLMPNFTVSIFIKSKLLRILIFGLSVFCGLFILMVLIKKFMPGFNLFQINIPNKYDYLSGYVVIIFSTSLMLIMLILILIRKFPIKNFLLIGILIFISLQFYSNLFWWYERYWNVTDYNGIIGNGVHWVTTPLLIQEAEYIKENHDPNYPIAIVTKYAYYPHILYMSNSRGYTLIFPEQGPDMNCLTTTNFPQYLSIPCVLILHQQGINDVFVMFYQKETDMDEQKFKDMASKLNLSYIGEMQNSAEHYGNVIHYKIDLH